MIQSKSFRAAVICLLLSSLSNVVYAADDRSLVILRPQETNMMLQDMRNYLEGLQTINQSIAIEDYQSVESAARVLGKIAIYEVKPVMSKNLVPKFRRMAVSVHDDFETLANMARNKKPPLEIIGHIGEMMQTCVTCHETFRVGNYAHESN